MLNYTRVGWREECGGNMHSSKVTKFRREVGENPAPQRRSVGSFSVRFDLLCKLDCQRNFPSGTVRVDYDVCVTAETRNSSCDFTNRNIADYEGHICVCVGDHVDLFDKSNVWQLVGLVKDIMEFVDGNIVTWEGFYYRYTAMTQTAFDRGLTELIEGAVRGVPATELSLVARAMVAIYKDVAWYNPGDSEVQIHRNSYGGLLWPQIHERFVNKE